MTEEMVCDILICGECLKPRCVYSQRKLTKVEYTELQCCKEEYLYTCDGKIILETSELVTLCCPEMIGGCRDAVSPHYFAARLHNYPCCHHCGAFGDLCPITAEMKRSYQNCASCLQ